jgi:MSHA biogenesis protein MshP
MIQSPSRLRGFAIVSAIFILVVLAALGAFIVSVSTNQQIGSVIDLQGVRAYQAARAGIEWGLYKVQSSNGFDYANPNTRSCPAATTTFVPTAPTLSGFAVTVTCTVRVDVRAGPTIYLITATACNEPTGAAPGTCPNTASPGSRYIERRLAASL